jgi:hypothetical protein
MASHQFRALTLRALRDRLQILDVYLVPSPPAPENTMYFVGSEKPGYFPFGSGPICYIRQRELDDLIPAQQVRSILRHLEITEQRFASTEGNTSWDSDAPRPTAKPN